MTDQTPIERAAEALQDRLLAGQRELNPGQALDAARASYEAIDTDQLADALWESVDDKGIQGRLYRADCDHYALAVKNWLTGNH